MFATEAVRAVTSNVITVVPHAGEVAEWPHAAVANRCTG
jgi:hypothetical protein